MEERKERRYRRVERRERKRGVDVDVTSSWKKISRAWAIGSTKAMRKAGR